MAKKRTRKRQPPPKAERRDADGLTPRQATFVREYLVDLNGTRAAERAGYSKKSANPQAARLLANASIGAAISRAVKRLLERKESTAERVLEELVMVAHSDIRRVVDASGHLHGIKDLPDDIARAVSSIEVIERSVGDEGKVELTKKLRLWDKNVALGNLARYHKLLTDKHEHSGEVEIKHTHLDKLSVDELAARAEAVASEIATLRASLGGKRK